MSTKNLFFAANTVLFIIAGASNSKAQSNMLSIPFYDTMTTVVNGQRVSLWNKVSAYKDKFEKDTSASSVSYVSNFKAFNADQVRMVVKTNNPYMPTLVCSKTVYDKTVTSTVGVTNLFGGEDWADSRVVVTQHASKTSDDHPCCQSDLEVNEYHTLSPVADPSEFVRNFVTTPWQTVKRVFANTPVHINTIISKGEYVYKSAVGNYTPN